jgi:hypothetical protein
MTVMIEAILVEIVTKKKKKIHIHIMVKLIYFSFHLEYNTWIFFIYIVTRDRIFRTDYRLLSLIFNFAVAFIFFA